MSEFDEWLKDYDKSHITHPSRQDCFEADQQSQQAKIDELNEVVNGWKDEYRIMTLRYERSKKQIDELQKQVITQGQNFNDQAQKLKDAEYFNQELQSMVDDLKELNRLKTIALQQSLNRTSIHVHEKIIALEKKLKGNKDEN